MKFSFEVPIHSLQELDECQDYLFVLAHQLLESKKYYNYVKNSKKYKILDNSAYELRESIEPSKLISLANDIKANVVVIPDKLFDKKRSKILEERFFQLIKNKKTFKLMKVVCGNNINEYLESSLEVFRDKKIDIVGISQSRNMITPNLSYLMTYLNRKIKSEKIKNKQIHLLGCSNPLELLEAKEWKNIKTIDTGRPINFSFKKIKLSRINRNDEYKKVSGYDINTKKKLDLELTKKNIRCFKEHGF